MSEENSSATDVLAKVGIVVAGVLIARGVERGLNWALGSGGKKGGGKKGGGKKRKS